MQEALTSADEGEDLRGRIARLVLAPLFQRVVIGLILINAVTLGLETSASVMASIGGALHARIFRQHMARPTPVRLIDLVQHGVGGRGRLAG